MVGTAKVTGLSADELVVEYLQLGLALGRHVDGFVDAYYGPEDLALRAASGAPVDPAKLAGRARRLLSEVHSTESMTERRRVWLAAQVRGLMTSATKLAGEEVGYLDEIEACYGVRPAWQHEDVFADAHRRIAEALDRHAVESPGTLAETFDAWRESHVVPPDMVISAMRSLAEDFRARTDAMFGLPEGEHVDFEVVTAKPWSGFNFYLGGLRSRVALNVDLPVLSLSLGHIVAHEAYPGHHTEHTRKEVGLVRRNKQLEESIFLVGTPQCLLAEGLADLALEVVAAPAPEVVLEGHFKALGIRYEAAPVAEVAAAGDVLSSVRGNAAIGIHDRGWSFDQAVDYVERWALTSRRRATKTVEFLTDPTWRAYPFCYIDGVRLCRSFVGGDPRKFARLLGEQLVPAELVEG